MSIRNAAKAVIMDRDKILLNRCRSESNERYYTLPGGGQNPYETMEEAVRRECLEETGYAVIVDKFAALYEEIIEDEELRAAYPDYTHKIFHIFLCHPENGNPREPSEKDSGQLGCEWVPVEKVKDLRFYPAVVGENIEAIQSGSCPAFLGSARVPSSLCVCR